MDRVTVIILTKNEELNIRECIVSAKQIADRVIVVDCGSIDNTKQIALSLNAECVFHEWEGHAAQFNWALDNCNIDTKWVFRLDADERISKELAVEINGVLNNKDKTELADGYEMRWRIYFMGKWIKHGGTHNIYFLRLFQFGKGRVENRIMDEHIVVNGRVEKLSGDLIHYDYKGLDAWLTKHIWYSNLEMRLRYGHNDNLTKKRAQELYYKLPLFIRAKIYYIYIVYFQLGFLDGKEGRIFAFFQAYWYRYLVDAKIYEREKNGKKDKDSSKEYL